MNKIMLDPVISNPAEDLVIHLPEINEYNIKRKPTNMNSQRI
jgi:hypothetical protein